MMASSAGDTLEALPLTVMVFRSGLHTGQVTLEFCQSLKGYHVGVRGVGFPSPAVDVKVLLGIVKPQYVKVFENGRVAGRCGIQWYAKWSSRDFMAPLAWNT